MDAGLSFQGSRCWGQFQTSRGVDERACAALVARLHELDPQKPWRVLPLVPLAVSAPIGVFRKHFA